MTCTLGNSYKIVPGKLPVTLKVGDTFNFAPTIRNKATLVPIALSGSTGIFKILNADRSVFYSTTAITFGNGANNVSLSVAAIVTALWVGKGLTYELTITNASFGTRTFLECTFTLFV